jgi:hypothetical protein
MVVLLEAVLSVGYGLYLAIETVIAPAADRLAAGVMAASAIVVGAALLLAVRAALRGRRAARAPIIVWQLMQLAVARLTVGTSWVPFGVALAILSIGALVASFWPGVLDEEAAA